MIGQAFTLAIEMMTVLIDTMINTMINTQDGVTE